MLQVLLIVMAQYGMYVAHDHGRLLMVCDDTVADLPQLLYRDNRGNAGYATACRGV